MSPRKKTDTAAFQVPECNELIQLEMPQSKEVRGNQREYNARCRALQVALIQCHYRHMKREDDRARARAMVIALSNADDYPVAYPTEHLR